MRILSVMMTVMLIFSSTVWAAGPAFTGNLRSSGVVLTNAVPAPDGGTVRSGDTVTTRPGALAVVTSATHGRVELRPDSEARFANDRLELTRGAVAATRLPVAVDGFTIQPQDPATGWFAVAKRDGRLVVAAHRGNVLIAAAGAPPVVVNEGAVAQQQEQQQQEPQPAQDELEKDKKKKRRRAAGAATGGWTIGSLGHAASVALVVGVGAGVAAASVGAAVALSDESPSPDL